MSRFFFTFALLSASFSVAKSDIVALEFNPAATPADTTFPAPLTEGGWLFVPTTTFDVSGVNTRFDSTDGRTVTVGIFETVLGQPNQMALTSGTFTAATTFAGATFGPVTLLAGVEYFVGFTNLAGLGVNYTNDPGATQLVARYSLAGDPLRFTNTLNTAPENQPILQFVSPAAVPEPSSLALLGLTGLVGGGLSWRRRRAAS